MIAQINPVPFVPMAIALAPFTPVIGVGVLL
jgi:hypothetical protein